MAMTFKSQTQGRTKQVSRNMMYSFKVQTEAGSKLFSRINQILCTFSIYK